MAASVLSRKLIRDNIKALLLDKTDAGENVFISRVNKAFIEELPGIFIYTFSDTPQLTTKRDQNFDREVIVAIEVIVAEKNKDQTIQDEADIIAAQIEDILLPNLFLQNPPPGNLYQGDPPAGAKIVNAIQIGETNLSRTDDIAEDLYGIITEYSITYNYDKATDPNITDFKRFQAKYHIGEDKEVAERLVEIPEV